MIKVLTRVNRSLKYAVAGIQKTFKAEYMFRFYSVVSVVVILIEIGLRVSISHIAISILAWSAVLSMELLNTGIEKAVDATEITNSLTEFAKDAGAGAVALLAITSAIITVLFLMEALLVFIQ